MCLKRAFSLWNPRAAIATEEEKKASPEFVASYGIDHIQIRHILNPREGTSTDGLRILGSSHGLFCLDYDAEFDSYGGVKKMYIIWNPSIRKSIRIVFPTSSLGRVYFGVCPVTLDPKLVIITLYDLKWLVEIYTLSSGSWRKISNNLPRGTIKLDPENVVTDRFIYWDATDSATTTTTNGSFIVSFDLTSEEFMLIDIPNYIAYHGYKISKLGETLVFLKYLETKEVVREVWMMMNNGESKTFTKLYNITPSILLRVPYKVRGFTNSGTPIIEMRNYFAPDGLYVYERNSERVTKLGFEEAGYGDYLCGFNVYTYQEMLLLFD
ncbi:F-box protein At2g16450-like [Rutidosis leptorrhynchoides]|uniref:F-box protein At2g16450-like n=1 Tax=Rutidosis leptorrhynchoides TaxID=125765 RepID=UPI003A9993CD